MADDVDPKAPTLAAATSAANVAAMTLTKGAAPQPSAAGSGAAAVVGRWLAHFKIEKLLGKGGMGEVYLATDVTLERQVALKLLPRDVARSPEARARFLREARAQARLVHPNIGHIYFIGEEDGQLFFAMELIEGESLQQRLDREGKLPPAEAIELVRMAALGLREAHRHGFTHRDIKPSNLLVDKHGVLKVVDFGIVHSARGGEAEIDVVGTPLYMSPEQARGDEVDFRADIYSLGVTLHHLVSGQPPFVARSQGELVSMHQTTVRPKLGKDTRGPTRGLLDVLCDKMMAKRPADRHASYDELLAELARLSPSVTRPAGFWVRAFAVALDAIVLSIVLVPAQIVLGQLHTSLTNEIIVAVFGLYTMLAHAYWGRTWGKKLLEIELVPTDRLGRVGLPRAFIRALAEWALPFLGVVELEPSRQSLAMDILWNATILGPFLCFGAVPMLFPSQRPLWDRVARTRVVYRQMAR
jgi:hypothetical protein